MAYIYSKNIAVPQIPGWKKPAVLRVMWLSIPIFFLDLFVKEELNKMRTALGCMGQQLRFAECPECKVLLWKSGGIQGRSGKQWVSKHF